MTDYYIKNGGNDGSDGLSDGNAWATLSKITNGSFNAGDNIYLNKGDTWNESFSVPSSGLDGSPITIDAYGSGAAPIVNGQSGGNADAILVTTKTDITIRNLTVNAHATAGNVAVHYISQAHRGIVELCTIVGHAVGACYGVHIEDSLECQTKNNDISTVSIGVLVEKNSGYNPDVYETYVGYNTVHDMSDQNLQENDAIQLTSDMDWTGTIVEQNDVSGFNEDGIDASVSNAIIQYNTIHNNGTAGEDITGVNGIKTNNSANGPTTYLKNHIYDLSQVGSKDCAGMQVVGRNIYQNLIHDITKAGTGTVVGIQQSASVGEAYNNTISNIAQYGMLINGGTLTTQNNICDGAVTDIRLQGSPTVTGGYNCLVNDAAPDVQGGSYSDTGSDDLGTTDPLFMNAAGDDYRLKSNSPCIEAGTPIAALTNDYDGIPLGRGTNPDIGAFETLKGGPRGL